jgi:transglutaminase-like putative cysteine protease
LVRSVGDPAAAGGFRTVWRVRVGLANREHRVRGDALGPLTAVPLDVLSRYLALDGRHADPGPELVAAAAAARREARDPLDLAFRLNRLVRERVVYDRDGRWDPAPVVWRTGRGSCSEYHFLYSTLCRLAGLPCRFVGATAWRGENGDLAYSDDVYHRWSEVFLPGYGWFPVDVSRNDGEDGEPLDQAFGKTSRGLCILSRGDGGDDDPLGVQYVARGFALDASGLPAERPRLGSDRVVRWRVVPAPTR